MAREKKTKIAVPEAMSKSVEKRKAIQREGRTAADARVAAEHRAPAPEPEPTEAPRQTIPIANSLVLLRLDERNWMLARERTREKGKRAGERTQVLVGYYPSLRLAALDAIDQLVGDDAAAGAAKDLKALVAAYKAADEKISRALLTPQVVVQP